MGQEHMQLCKSSWLFALVFETENRLICKEEIMVYDKKDPYPVRLASEVSRDYILDLYNSGVRIVEAKLCSVIDVDSGEQSDSRLVEECTIVRRQSD